MDDCKCVNIVGSLGKGKNLTASVKCSNEIVGEFKQGSSGGTNDYRQLSYLPTINGEKVIDDKKSKDYHVQDEMDFISNIEMDKMLGGI